MKPIYSILVLVLLFLGIYFLTKTREPGPIEDRGSTAVEAASNMRKLLPQLVTEDNYARMGFHSLAEIAKAEPGAPIIRIRLRGDSILRYDTSKGENLDPWTFSKQQVVPLLVEGRARSTVIVDSARGRAGNSGLHWQAQEVGNPSLALVIDSALPKQAALVRLPVSAFTMVEIPAMNRMYLAYYTADGGYFLLADDEPPLCWPGDAGKPVRISLALAAMSSCRELKTAYEPAPKMDPTRQYKQAYAD
jgi:hypothetical protein